MPSVSLIRREMLNALEQHIIPQLYEQQVALGNVKPPFLFQGSTHARLHDPNLPVTVDTNVGYPTINYWPGVELESSGHPFVGFIYEGVADEHTLVDEREAGQFGIEKGIYAIRWQAPAILHFGVERAHNAGYGSRWDGPGLAPKSMKALWMYIAEEVFIHLNIMPVEIPHALHISDKTLIRLAHLYCQEMEEGKLNHPQTALAIYLAMMLRLRECLRSELPRIANTAWPSGDKHVAGDTPLTAWQDAMMFIQLHLHEEITLPLIAERVGISVAQLNRQFQKNYGVTVMRYVKLQRIEGAKMMLTVEPENISEIATQLGFKSVQVFCSVFQQEVGMTPSQYRRLTQKEA